MSEFLIADHFLPYVGDTFVIISYADHRINFTLQEVNNSKNQSTAFKRQPFSLLFSGPVQPSLPQATYQFNHSVLGVMEIFIVPVGKDQESIFYEAIYS